MRTESFSFLLQPRNLILATAIAIATSSCGVRGNPQPPLDSPVLGHGQPGFKRASEEFAFPNVPTATPAPAAGPREETR